MLLAIIENMQREDLNPIEEAEGISQMIDTYGLTQEQVSKSVGEEQAVHYKFPETSETSGRDKKVCCRWSAFVRSCKGQ